MCLSRRIRSHLMPACTCLTLHSVPETKHIRAWLCNNVPVYGLKSGPLSGWKPAIVRLLRTPSSLVAKSTQDTMLWFKKDVFGNEVQSGKLGKGVFAFSKCMLSFALLRLFPPSCFDVIPVPLDCTEAPSNSPFSFFIFGFAVRLVGS